MAINFIIRINENKKTFTDLALRNASEIKPEDNTTKEQNAAETKPKDDVSKDKNSTNVKDEGKATNEQNSIGVKPDDNVTKDPIMDQIASELDNELKEGGVNKEDKNKQRPSPIIRNRFLDVKPTLRIHLARSTKLPLPLSENNAFCYFVPRTPLCNNGT